jgi:hypothetical protein
MGSMCPTCRNRRDDGLFSHQPKMLLSGAREKARRSGLDSPSFGEFGQPWGIGGRSGSSMSP